MRHIQKKCRELNCDLYMVFVGHTKAFDSAVNGTGLCKLLAKVGCPDKIVDVIRSFHDGMEGQSARLREIIRNVYCIKLNPTGLHGGDNDLLNNSFHHAPRCFPR